MWNMEFAVKGKLAWLLSDEKLSLDLDNWEAIEMLATLKLLLDQISVAEFQREMELVESRCEAPHVLRGDLITIDPDDPNVFVLRVYGLSPNEDRMPRDKNWRTVEYRVSRSEAKELLQAFSGFIEDPVEQVHDDEYDDDEYEEYEDDD